MACPPEDSNGFEGSGSHGYIEMLAEYPSMSKEAKREVRKGVLTATNYKDETKFNPWVFDIEAARKRVSAALASRQSVCLFTI